MSSGVLPWVYPVWDSLSFLDLGVSSCEDYNLDVEIKNEQWPANEMHVLVKEVAERTVGDMSQLS